MAITSGQKSSLVAAKRQKSLLDTSELMEIETEEIDPVLEPNTAQDAVRHAGHGTSNEESRVDNGMLFEEDDHPTEGQVLSAFQKRDMGRLAELLRDVTRQLPQSIRAEQAAATKRIAKAEATIEALRRENMTLKERVRAEHAEVSEMKRNQAKLERDCRGDVERLQSMVNDARQTHTQMAEQLKHMEQTHPRTGSSADMRIAMMQILTGVNCYNVMEDQDSMYFSINQRSIYGQLNYQLVISKDESLNEAIYMPLWEKPADYTHTDEEWNQNVAATREMLPPYLQDDLTFSADTLHSFYCKITKCLKKD